LILRPPPLPRSALVVAAVVTLWLAGCASSEETAADLPQPEAQSRPTYRTPATRKQLPASNLGRIVDEAERRRQVIRQLDEIFKTSQP